MTVISLNSTTGWASITTTGVAVISLAVSATDTVDVVVAATETAVDCWPVGRRSAGRGGTSPPVDQWANLGEGRGC